MELTKSKTTDLVYIAMGAVLIAICSWISIPLPIPFTLQTLGVFFVTGLLGGKRGFLAVLLYILLGAIGMPVFAGFLSGFQILLGSTGGYLVGFLCSTLLMWGIESIWGNRSGILLFSMFVGLIACYGFGTVWFMLMYARGTGDIGVLAALGMCVFPFVIPDSLKIVMAVLLVRRVKKYVL